MKQLLEGQNGHVCAAKSWFSIAAFVILSKFALGGMSFAGVSFGEFDAAGASMLLSAFGAVYFGRSHTKAKTNDDSF